MALGHRATYLDASHIQMASPKILSSHSTSWQNVVALPIKTDKCPECLVGVYEKPLQDYLLCSEGFGFCNPQKLNMSSQSPCVYTNPIPPLDSANIDHITRSSHRHTKLD